MLSPQQYRMLLVLIRDLRVLVVDGPHDAEETRRELRQLYFDACEVMYSDEPQDREAVLYFAQSSPDQVVRFSPARLHDPEH